MKIVALDLGKSKVAGCVYETQTCAVRYDRMAAGRGEMQRVMEMERPDRVVIEVGPTAGWVGDVVRQAGIALQVANPNHEAWRWRNVKRKTDRLDALKLAELSAAGQLPLVHLPEPRVRQWRELIQYRHALVGRLTAVKNRMRAFFTGQGLPFPSSKTPWTLASVDALRAEALPWKETQPENLWRGALAEELQQYDQLVDSIQRVEQRLSVMADEDSRVKMLRTIPGVGPRLAEALVALIDDAQRFRSGKQVAAYLGLVPRQYQSGDTDRHGRITGQGNRRVRSLLIEVSWLGLRHNSWMRETFERLCRGSATRRKTAIVGVARRLAIRCWAMMRDRATWAPPLPAGRAEPRSGPVKKIGSF